MRFILIISLVITMFTAIGCSKGDEKIELQDQEPSKQETKKAPPRPGSGQAAQPGSPLPAVGVKPGQVPSREQPKLAVPAKAPAAPVPPVRSMQTGAGQPAPVKSQATTPPPLSTVPVRGQATTPPQSPVVQPVPAQQRE